MRIYSTPKSAEEGEVTLLAIIETIGAVSVSVWLAIHYQTINHILVGACLAPLFLLRTPLSTVFAWVYALRSTWSLVHFTKILQPMSNLSNFMSSYPYLIRVLPSVVLFVSSILFLLVLLCLVGVSFLLGRVLALIISIFSQSPAITLSAIPSNWRRLTWATDFLHPPEVVPGIETIPDSAPANILSLRGLAFTSVLKQLYAAEVSTPHLYALTFLKTLLVLSISFAWFLPAVLFRLSVKSTSIVYYPLIYIVNQPLATLSTKEIIADIMNGRIEVIRRILALLTLMSHGISIAILLFSIMFLNWLYQNGGPVGKILFDIFLPTDGLHLTIKGWHIAQITNALIALGLWLYADTASRRIDGGHWHEQKVKTVIGILRTIQAVLTVFTVACTLTILFNYRFWELLPQMEFQFFP